MAHSPNAEQLVAHRGFMAHYPENSWLGLQAAIDAGAHWLEFDLQMCGDGTLVMLHDDSLQRTAGCPDSVFDLHWSQLRQLSVHEPDRFGMRFAPLPPSTLGEVLERLALYPQVRSMVEIKQESLDRWGMERVMDSLLKEMTGHQQRHLLISYNQDALRYSQSRSPLQLGWVMHSFTPEQLRFADELAPAYLICNHKKIGRPQPLPEGPWKWMLYDICDVELARAWLEKGADLVETGDIAALLQNDAC